MFEVVRRSVEKTLNGLLEAEADALCLAKRYECNAQPTSTRVDHCRSCSVQGSKTVAVPFEIAIIERYRRREGSVEEALVARHVKRPHLMGRCACKSDPPWTPVFRKGKSGL